MTAPAGASSAARPSSTAVCNEILGPAHPPPPSSSPSHGTNVLQTVPPTSHASASASSAVPSTKRKQNNAGFNPSKTLFQNIAEHRGCQQHAAEDWCRSLSTLEKERLQDLHDKREARKQRPGKWSAAPIPDRWTKQEPCSRWRVRMTLSLAKSGRIFGVS